MPESRSSDEPSSGCAGETPSGPAPLLQNLDQAGSWARSLPLILEAARAYLFRYEIAADRIEHFGAPDIIPGFGAFVGRQLCFADIFALIHPDDRAHFQRCVDQQIAAGGHYSCSYRILQPDGGVRHVLDRGWVTRSPDGQPVILEGAVLDVTELEMARAAAEQAEQRFRSARDASVEGLGLLHALRAEEGRIGDFVLDYINPAAGRLLGLDPAEAEASRLLVRFPDWAMLIEQFAQVMETGRPYEDELRVEHGAFDGWMAISAVPVKNGVAVSLRNITRRKRLETELRAAAEAKAALLREVNHRVKNSLQIVSSMMSITLAHTMDPRARQAVAEAAGRIDAVSMAHERLYRTDSLETADAGAYLRDLCADLAYSGGDVDIRFSCDPITLGPDRLVPLGLAANEMVTNALKYAYAGRARGPVHVGLHCLPAHDLISLRVEDEGKGLEAGIGTAGRPGLGMTLLQALAAQLEGLFRAGNRSSGQGACFEIIFPVERSDATSAHG